MSLCIGDDVALATFDLFARIKAAVPSALGCLDRSTVDDRRRWLRLPTIPTRASLIKANAPLSRRPQK
jgi:hypothetical protein